MINLKFLTRRYSNFNKKFFINFLKQPQKVGSVIPTWGGCCELITSLIELDKSDTVVELGPGTGSFTKKILTRVGSETTFFALEINPEFVNALRNQFPGRHIYQDSASEIIKYLKIHKKTTCDTIISGIPWTLIPFKEQDKILKAIHSSLRLGGSFLTIAYVSGMYLPTGIKFKKKLQRYFSIVNRTNIIWKNIPPVFIYHCIK